jgi:transposase
MRTRIMNQLQSVAMNEGIQRRGGLRSEPGRKRLEQLPLAPWAAKRRQDLLALLEQLNERVEELSAAIQQEAEKRPEAQLLMTHPGVGPITALAFVLIIAIPPTFSMWKADRQLCGTARLPCETTVSKVSRTPAVRNVKHLKLTAAADRSLPCTRL